MKLPLCFLFTIVPALLAPAEVPRLINYQGRVAVDSINFQGTGQFRFALVNQDGSVTYWRSSPDAAPADGIPDSAVSLNVEKGLYSVLLGDASLSNMAALTANALEHPDVRLRVWFDDGIHGVQRLSPDQRLAAVAYALMAADVADGTITSEKIANSAITSDKISTGAITGAHLAPGAIPAGNVGPGSIGATELANGSVDFSKLAKPPQSGSFDASILPFGASIPFSITFPQAYQTPPVVTAALAANLPGTLKGLSVNIGTVTATGFAGTIEKLPTDSGVAPSLDPGFSNEMVRSISVGEAGGKIAVVYHRPPNGQVNFAVLNPNADSNGQFFASVIGQHGSHPSLCKVNGRPAFSFNHLGTLGFYRALDAAGSSWYHEWVTVSTGGTYLETRLGIIAGKPAIAFVGAGVGFVRASDADGTSWTEALIVDASGNGSSPSLAEVNGHAAICYVDTSTFALKYVRAANPEGTAWSSPITVSGSGSHHYTAMKVVEGRPAICFYNGATLKYIRANDADGASWPAAAVVVDTENGEHPSLEVIDGKPAVAYQDLLRKDLRYAVATDATGSAWGTPRTLDSEGDAGTFAALANVGGAPVIVAAAPPGMSVKMYRPILSYRINWIALPQ